MAKSFYFVEYQSLLIFLIVTFFIAAGFVLISYLSASQIGGTEKLSAYECGFEPFEDARNSFNIQFYIIAILFIVFDIELVLLLPWSVTFFFSGAFVFWIVIDFIIELLVGYYYIFKRTILSFN